jgi:hypothetical protein
MPPLELAHIFQQHADEYVENHGSLSHHERRILYAIQFCRTAAFGGHVEECDSCGHREISYNSCRNVHCPKCQAAARRDWLKARQREILPVEYFHIVFTLPEEFRLLALQNRSVVYGILFLAAAHTLCQLARDPKHLGAEIGIFGILHTWGQNLCHHPHVHFVVPGGGLSPDKTTWVSANRRFFLPVRVLRTVFRGKFIHLLKRAFAKGELTFRGSLAKLADPQAFEAILDKASKHQWVVYAKAPFGGPTQVLKYLARYTHRVAISNERLLSMKDGHVSFRWKDYADNNKTKVLTLTVLEFMRRFFLHIVPPGFKRIRYYGFLATRNRGHSLSVCRQLLSEATQLPTPHNTESEDPPDSEEKPKPCPACKNGAMIVISYLAPVPVPPRTAPVPEPVNTS